MEEEAYGRTDTGQKAQQQLQSSEYGDLEREDKVGFWEVENESAQCGESSFFENIERGDRSIRMSVDAERGGDYSTVISGIKFDKLPSEHQARTIFEYEETKCSTLPSAEQPLIEAYQQQNHQTYGAMEGDID